MCHLQGLLFITTVILLAPFGSTIYPLSLITERKARTSILLEFPLWVETLLLQSDSTVISPDVDSITSLGSLFQSLTTLSVFILPDVPPEAPWQRLIPHFAATHGPVHLEMGETAQQWGSGSSCPRKHPKTGGQWMRGKWVGDCTEASGFCFPNSFWICNKMTTCGEEEEGHRFPSEECPLASKSHTAFPSSSLSPSASLVQSVLHLQEGCGRFSLCYLILAGSLAF